jgi:flagellar basal body-associated protein FliL
MVDSNLMTIFVALIAVAVLIQTGILVGFYFLSAKLSRQADRAMDATRTLVGPLHTVADNLQDVSGRVVLFGATAQEKLRQLENWWTRRTS